MIQIDQPMQAPPDLWRVEFHDTYGNWRPVQAGVSQVAVLAPADLTP